MTGLRGGRIRRLGSSNVHAMRDEEAQCLDSEAVFVFFPSLGRFLPMPSALQTRELLIRRG
jgi:hypothetical protein